MATVPPRSAEPDTINTSHTQTIPSHLLHVDLLPHIPSRMYYNPKLCIHAMVDKESRSYNICSVWKEQGFLSDVDPIYDIKQWQQPQKCGINVSLIPFTDTDIELNELEGGDIPNNFLFNYKNRILEYIHNDEKRQSILKQFGGLSFKAQSLKLIRSRKEISPLIQQLQDTTNNLRMIAIFIEFKWNQNKYFISIKPRRYNKPEEKSVIICLFVYNGIETNVFDGLIMKSCILIQRAAWIEGMYKRWPYHQIHFHFLYLSQFWLHTLTSQIVPYWSAHYCGNKKIKLTPMIIPARFIPYFYQKRFRMYTNEGDTYTYWYHRNHFVRRVDLHPPQIIIDSDADQEQQEDDDEDGEEVNELWKLLDDNVNNDREEFVHVGIECYDAIFDRNDVTCIMNDIDEYLQNTKQPHFALEYKMHKSEEKVIEWKYKDVSTRSKYTHNPKTYELWKNDDDLLSSEVEYDTEDDEERKFYCLGYYNFIDQNKQKRSRVQKNKTAASSSVEKDVDTNVEPKIDQIFHQAVGAIPIPVHFQQAIVPTQSKDGVRDKGMKRKRKRRKRNSRQILDHTGYKHAKPRVESTDDSRWYSIPKSIKEGTKEHHEAMLKRYVYKYNKIRRRIRDRDRIKHAMSGLNAMYLRCYIHKYPSRVNNIDITNDLPMFWTHIIKPRLLKYGLNKVSNYFQFAFVFECVATDNYIKIPLFCMNCGEDRVYFQNSELCLMVFCVDSVTMYLDDISLIVVPGRIYTFDSNSLRCNYIKIFNHKNMKIDIVMLRNTPCIKWKNEEDEEYVWMDVNHYNKNVCLIQLDDDEEFYEVIQDEEQTHVWAQKADEDIDYYTETHTENESENETQIKKKIKKIKPRKILTKNKVISVKHVQEKVCTNNEDTRMNSNDKKQNRLISQDILTFNTLGVKSLQKPNEPKRLINEALDIQDLEQQRKQLRKLRGKIPDFKADIQFYIGNAYERGGNKRKAVSWYDRALEVSYKNRGYRASSIVHHKYDCMQKMNGTQSIPDDLIQYMQQAWRNVESDDEKCKTIRKQWIRRNEIELELIFAARCAMDLARHWEDILEFKNESRWNDTSLLWYKRALNILEKVQLMMIQRVPIHQVVQQSMMCDTQWISSLLKYFNNEKKETETIQRKRINVQFANKHYFETAEDVIQNYMQCIIERFRNEQYTTHVEEDIATDACFVDFHTSKEKYSSDFELYLEYELDSLFEITHFYFSDEELSKKNNTNSEIGDVYINYASYLTDVRKKHEAALLFYKHSLEYNKDPTACWNMAEVFENTCRYDDAVKSLDLVLELTAKEYPGIYQQTMHEVNEIKERIEKKKTMNESNHLTF